MDLTELEADAKARLDDDAVAYIVRGDSTANIAGWQRHALRPHVLRDVSRVATATTLLGVSVPSPVFIAPTAMHALVCDDAERATARAAARANTVMCVSMAASCTLEEIAAAAPGAPRFAQMYVLRDRGLTRELARRAAAATYDALVVSVDGAAVPYGNPASQLTPHVARLVDEFDPSVTFDDIGHLREWSGLPLVVKGVVRGDDARRCVDAGAAAIYVSNHGGRIVPECVDTAAALDDVIDAVGGSAEVYVDGGIRSGVGVLRALSLGARGVGLGRPILWGLAVDAENGAFNVLESFRAELTRAMAFCGAARVDEVGRDLLALAR